MRYRRDVITPSFVVRAAEVKSEVGCNDEEIDDLKVALCTPAT